MKFGFSSTIPQTKDRVRSGTLPSHLDQRRPEWANQEWNSCSSFFIIQRKLFIRRLCHPNRLWIKHFTYRYSSVWETELCASAVKLQIRGSFTTTMRQVTHHSLWGNFWLHIISQRFPTHRTALTWLRAISFYSPRSKPTPKGIILGQLKTCRQLRRGLWTTSQVKNSPTTMKSDSNAGIAEFDHKEPILKGINCNCIYVQYIFLIILIIFATNVVHTYMCWIDILYSTHNLKRISLWYSVQAGQVKCFTN